jgi:Holliday junction resolvasome RuvABC endonuclease subunit
MHALLGLDVSTTCTGWAFIDLSNGGLISYGKIEPLKDNYWDRVIVTVNSIRELFKTPDMQIAGVGIEQLNWFRNAESARQLAGISGVVQYVLRQSENIIVNELNTSMVSAAFRKGVIMDPKLPKKAKTVAAANARFGLNLKFKDRPVKGRKVSDDDMADAIAVAFTLYREIGEDLRSQLTIAKK